MFKKLSIARSTPISAEGLINCKCPVSSGQLVPHNIWLNRPLARCVKLRIAHAPGTFSSPPRVSDPDMHHGTCVTHVPWWMPGSLTSGFLCGGENVPGIPGACTIHNFTYLARGPCSRNWRFSDRWKADLNMGTHIYVHFNILRPRNKTAVILQTPFSTAFSWQAVFVFCFQIHRSVFPSVQLIICHHQFR